MGNPWGIGCFREGGSPILSKSPKKKNSVKISEKAAKSGKKIGKIRFFLLKMVQNELGTPRNTFKSQKYVKKNIKSAKSGKNRKNQIFPT